MDAIARNVSDCAAVFEVIAGYDAKDSTSVKMDDYHFTEALVDDVKGLRIGIPKGYLGEGLGSGSERSCFGSSKDTGSKRRHCGNV